MAADTLSETDDDELIIVETDTIPPPEQINAEDDTDTDVDDSADADDEDERLVSGDEEDEDDGNPNRKKRIKRRQVVKQAKEKTLQELRFLRQQNEDMVRRLAAVEGNALSYNNAQLDQRLSDTQREVQQAETIIARAVEAGNGDDVAVAMRMRDEAMAREAQLYSAKTQIEQARTQPAPVDPRVTSLGQQWMEANPWYDPRGSNEDSAVTNAIDTRLVAEGYNPASVEYWEELTRRVSARINTDDTPPSRDRKRAPPMGTSREHVPPSTKKAVFVTPDRKQAMIDAGVWDDPVRRAQMLKAYQAYDRNPPR